MGMALVISIGGVTYYSTDAASSTCCMSGNSWNPRSQDEPAKSPPWWVAFLPVVVPRVILPTSVRSWRQLVRVIFQPCWRSGRWKSLT